MNKMKLKEPLFFFYVDENKPRWITPEGFKEVLKLRKRQSKFQCAVMVRYDKQKVVVVADRCFISNASLVKINLKEIKKFKKKCYHIILRDIGSIVFKEIKEWNELVLEEL